MITIAQLTPHLHGTVARATMNMNMDGEFDEANPDFEEVERIHAELGAIIQSVRGVLGGSER